MELPDALSQHDPRLVKYVLGLLPEEEAERLDEASIADDEVASALSSVESDLVDAYVTGTLNRCTRDQFETSYLTSPRRREKVKFARRFLAVVDRASGRPQLTPVATPGLSRAPRAEPAVETTAVSGPARFSWSLLATAASIALVGGLFINDLQLRQGLRDATVRHGAQVQRTAMLEKQLADARNETAQTAQALEEARLAAAADRPPAAAPAARTPFTTQAAVLFPQTRALGEPPTIAVPATERPVAFELRLESDEFQHYRVLLKDAMTGRIVWRSAVLIPPSHSRESLSVLVPSRVLTSPHYSFELTGLDSSGHGTTIGSYAVQIERP